MKYVRTLCAGVTLLICSYGNAERLSITVGVEDLDYYPHYDFSEGKKSGYVYDFLKLFEESSNYSFIFLAMPVKRLKYQFFEKQSIDLLYPFNPQWANSAEAALKLNYSEAIINILGGTIVATNNLGGGLANFRYLAVPRGFTPIEWYKIRGKINVEFVEVANSLDALKMVIKGRADGADIEYNVARQLMMRHGLQDQLALDPSLPFSAVGFHFVTIEKQSVLTKMQDFIKSHQTDIEKLKRQYRLVESLDEIRINKVI